jgi:hypothetical protein
MRLEAVRRLREDIDRRVRALIVELDRVAEGS